MKILLTLSFFLLASPAKAFIPPVPSILKEVFGERRGASGVEAHIKHKVTVRPGEVVEVDEKIIRDSTGVYFLWKMPSVQATPIAARYEKQAYWVSKERNLPTRSTVYWKYFVAGSDDEIRDALLSERFIRRDQFHQYKPGFNPSGDPQTWNLKENVVRHEDIYLSRVASSVSIAIRGYQEGNTARVVYFDQNLKSMTRLEWQDNENLASWSFEGATKSAWEKVSLPKRSSLEINRSVVVQSETVAVRSLKDRALFESKNAWNSAAKSVNVPPNAEAVLKLLVSYR